jgi:hypothetical protein
VRPKVVCDYKATKYSWGGSRNESWMVRLNRLVPEQAVLVAVSLAVYAVEVLWLLLESRGNQATMHSTNSWPSGHEERAASSEAAEAAGAPEAPGG